MKFKFVEIKLILFVVFFLKTLTQVVVESHLREDSIELMLMVVAIAIECSKSSREYFRILMKYHLRAVSR